MKITVILQENGYNNSKILKRIACLTYEVEISVKYFA
jgi:hypothetical protein